MAKKLTPFSRLAPTPESKLQYPITIKGSNSQEVVLSDPQVTRVALLLMNAHSVNGGAACHWGGASAVVEIMTVIHGFLFIKPYWDRLYNFVNDIGHAENSIYALRANYQFNNTSYKDLEGFRSIESVFTGHAEAHINPAGVLVSNGPLGSGLPQAQGLAQADKAKNSDRITVCVISDGASMEGEAKEAFTAIPGFAAKGKINPMIVIISDNNTKLSGRINEDSYSMDPYFKSLKTLGWNVLKIKQGNDLTIVYQAFEKAISLVQNNPNQPVCLWVKTVKGYGLKQTEKSSNGGHGFPLGAYDPKITELVQEIYGKEEPPVYFTEWTKRLASLPKPEKTKSLPTSKIQVGITNALIESSKKGYPIFSVSSDLQGSTGLAGFHKKFPERFIDVGVAEANMVSVASGFSLTGYIPIVDTFAQFGTTKGNLPILMSNLSKGGIIGVFSHTGFQDAADGASHQSLHYFASVSSIPMTQVVNCCNQEEAYYLMSQAIDYFYQIKLKGNSVGSIIFFIGRENFPNQFDVPMTYEWGKANVLTTGNDVVIVATGAMTWKALEAQKLLEKQNISATVINSAFINHPDIDTIKLALDKCQGKLITIEDHRVLGGMGAMLVHELAQAGVSLKVKSLGIDNSFGRSAYVANHLYNSQKLNAQSIVEAYHQL